MNLSYVHIDSRKWEWKCSSMFMTHSTDAVFHFCRLVLLSFIWVYVKCGLWAELLKFLGRSLRCLCVFEQIVPSDWYRMHCSTLMALRRANLPFPFNAYHFEQVVSGRSLSNICCSINARGARLYALSLIKYWWGIVVQCLNVSIIGTD